MPNYRNEPYHYLGTSARKVPSAWTEVWSGTWPSMASMMTPKGRDLDAIWTIFVFLGGLVILYRIITKSSQLHAPQYNHIVAFVYRQRKVPSAWMEVGTVT